LLVLPAARVGNSQPMFALLLLCLAALCVRHVSLQLSSQSLAHVPLAPLYVLWPIMAHADIFPHHASTVCPAAAGSRLRLRHTSVDYTRLVAGDAAAWAQRPRTCAGRPPI
jgi:hypothetical protein